MTRGTAEQFAVTYHRLTPAARETIKAADVSIADYIRFHFADGDWRGDRCGCIDDRCIGYHHEENEPCDCLSALLSEWTPRSEFR